MNPQKKGIKELYYLDPRYLWYDLTDSKYKYIDINSKTQIVTPTKKGEAIYDVVFY